MSISSELRAQTAVNHYYVNDGTNNTHDPGYAEFAIDLGGMIPFSTYVSGGHYYKSRWLPTTPTFQDTMRAGMLDFGWLNSQIIANCSVGTTPIYPLNSSAWFLETTPTGPIVKNTWWTASGSTRRVFLWPYRVNGAPALIAIRESPTGSGQIGLAPTPAVMYVQYSYHHSDFGVNLNRIVPGTWGLGEFEAPEAGWSGGGGVPQILGTTEQALEAGDIVVFVQENQSDGVWVALQCLQDANWLLRGPFAQAPPNPAGGTFPAISGIGTSFLHGGSWGCLMSNVLATLQPKLYGGSAGVVATPDISFGIRDKIELQTFYLASIGGLALSMSTDSNYAQWYNLVDLLDMRFDRPGLGWDLAAFSTNRRSGADGLKVPMYGMVGDEDHIFHFHWHQRDGQSNSLYRTTARKNAEHGMAWGIKPGSNEFAVFTGNEWATMKQQGGTTSTNNTLVPSAAAPSKVFPDPYSTTLRHDANHGESTTGFLAEDDLSSVINPSYEVSPLPNSARVKRIGQGVWPGFHDSMRVGDVDGDNNVEIVFGNLDGYVHVLQFNYAASPSDPFKLFDEWQSDYLGRGLCASAAIGSGALTGYFTNALGQIWKMTSPAANDYAMSLIASPATASSKYLYQGETPWIYAGDFASSGTQNELLVVNRFLDWSLFQTNGVSIGSGRLQRGTRIVGPSQAVVVDLDQTDARKELLVPASDGFLWKLDPEDSSGTKWPVGASGPVPFLPSNTNLSLYRVVPCYFNGGATPSHLLLFGRNDSRANLSPPLSTNVIQLYDYSTKALIASADADPGGINSNFDESISFVWITPPASGFGTATFVIGTSRLLQKFAVTLNGPLISPLAAVSVFPPMPVGFERSSDRVTSLHTAALTDSSGVQTRLVMATSDGRIWVLDTDLNYLRKSFKEVSPSVLPPNPTPTEVRWPSNRSLGRTFACDFDRDATNGSAHLYFAEHTQPLYQPGNAGPRYRVGEIVLTPGTPPAWSTWGASWGAYLADARNAALFPEYRTNNRTLVYRDLDPNVPGREARVLAETGAVYVDSSMVVHELQTCAALAPFLSTPGRSIHGGHVFEIVSLANPPAYNYLGGFSIPRDGAIAFDDFRPGHDDWWYPVIGPNRLSGQIANYTQSAQGYHFGTAMKTVQLTKSLGGSPSLHVVVGTNGGFVYAIEPGSTVTNNNRGSNLSFGSNDLGTHVIGLDVGNLLSGTSSSIDVDTEPEIAVGTLVDTGDYVDWNSGTAPTRNRGKLYLLNPQPTASGTNGTFLVTELNGDDLLGVGNGIGAGVTGVKIDDVNGDGTNEIWCGDAVGHLYLFKWNPNLSASNKWACIYRSKDLGCFPGCYNNIYPIKDTSTNKTEKLLVVSAGYVTLFKLDRSKLGL